jgi:hypothetical protein
VFAIDGKTRRMQSELSRYCNRKTPHMATYKLFGTGNTLFNAHDGTVLAPRILYVLPTEFGFLNANGSKTFFTGTGLVFDQATGRFTGGTVTGIKHFNNGTYTFRPVVCGDRPADRLQQRVV